ncbi:MAG: trigger factor family protein [Bacteroidales bacterium]|nr:trigger factor family protein [Bacteroidales bacterium]
MKITDKKIDALNLELTLEIVKDDYVEIERKKFAQLRRTADFKGFRKGYVPDSLVRRVYGGQVLAESVNEVISSSLDSYINEHKLHILGEPLSSENQAEVEWVDGNDFTFVFDVAVSPEVSLELGKEDVVNSYNIDVTAKAKAPMIENLKKYYYEEKKEEKSDEDIDKEVTERLKSEYKQESEWRLSKDIRDYVVGKAAIELPDAFLKRWLFVANDGKVTREDIEKDYEGFAADFRWQLVRGYLMKKYGFTVEEADIRDAAKAYVAYQYAMYGLGNVPEEMLQEAAQNLLSDRKQIGRLEEQVEDRKVMEKLRGELTIKPKKISAEKFRELK